MAVGNYEVFALVCEQFGKYCGRELNAVLLAERYVVPVVVFYDTRFDVSPAAVGTRVIVRDESYCRGLFVGVCGKSGVQVSVVVKVNVIEVKAVQFLFQVFREYKLLLCAWGRCACFARLGVEAYIVEESFY